MRIWDLSKYLKVYSYFLEANYDKQHLFVMKVKQLHLLTMKPQTRWHKPSLKLIDLMDIALSSIRWLANSHKWRNHLISQDSPASVRIREWGGRARAIDEKGPRPIRQSTRHFHISGYGSFIDFIRKHGVGYRGYTLLLESLWTVIHWNLSISGRFSSRKYCLLSIWSKSNWESGEREREIAPL